MTMGGGEDRLSDLSDDLLRRILYFVPSKEAASTSVLSRRWGSLWRSSGAVNLVVEAYDYLNRRHRKTYCYEEATFLAQEAFVRAATAALDATEGPVTRLTLLVETKDGEIAIGEFLYHGRDGWCTDADASVVGVLLSHQAARRVEELRVAAVDLSSDGASLYLDKENHRCTGVYGLASLPSSATLRVLDLTRCTLTAAAFANALPRLATLRLRHCAGEPKVLQALLDAAPELTTVRLESLFFLLPHHDGLDGEDAEPAMLRLRFHEVTALVLSLCGKESRDRRGGKSSWAIEIDAPRLQSIKYKGLVRRFILRPAAAPAGIARVDLHFLRDHDKDDGKETRRALFWQFVRNFANARTLKLKVGNDLKDIAAIGEASFPRLEFLELEGMQRPKIKTAAAAIANLLHCCPVLGEIMLKLNSTGREFLDRKDRLDYNKKSSNRFMRQEGSKTAISMEDRIFGDKYSYVDVPSIPGLSGRSFACLQRTLRRVNLQFQLDYNSISNCLGLRLIKFFADHASVLEEICVDTGNRRLNEHLSFNVETQMTLAPAMRISATTSFIQNKESGR